MWIWHSALVSHHKSYTVIVGGSLSPKAFQSMNCMKVCLYDVLICFKIGWRQLDLSWAHPFTGRDSKVSEHIQNIYYNKYLGSTLEEDGELDAEVPLSVQNYRLEEQEDNIMWSVG